MEIAAVIFDMDGVVIDSNPFVKKVWNHFLKSYGIFPDERIFREVIFGTPGHLALKTLLGKNFTDDQISRFIDHMDADYRRQVELQADLQPLKGLEVFLNDLKNSGYKIALATSAPDANISTVLNKFQIRQFFDVIVGKKDVIRGKPDPEVYLKTLEKLTMHPKQCIVFEDSVSGILAATGAGISVTGVTTSHRSEDLIEAGAFTTIHNFSEMNSNIIRKINFEA